VPRPVAAADRYLPGVDGVRALAVSAVVLYHLGVPGMAGGLLGVGVFFTLSGFLITGLLLDVHDRSGDLQLREFWLRRARRLLPALVLVLSVVLAVTAVVDHDLLEQRWREAKAALLFAGNWQTIGEGTSYFDRFGGPGPLDHLWSLAVEEQFYLVWPVLLLGLLAWTGGRRTLAVRATLALAGVSFVLLAVLARPGFDHTRAYEGTDTRAGALLVGAAVAFLWRRGRMPTLTPGARTVLEVAGVTALAAVVLLVTGTDEHSMSIYYGGLLALSAASAVLVAVAAHPSSWLGRLLGVPPLRWLGERSYGIYLWHLPVLVFVPAGLFPGQPRIVAAGQVLLILALAALSWRFVEDPIRREGFVRACGLTGVRTAPSPGAGRRLALGVLGCAVAGTVVMSVSSWLAELDPPDETLAARWLGGETVSTDQGGRGDRDRQTRSDPASSLAAATVRSDQTQRSSRRQHTTERGGGSGGPAEPRTSCRSVVHVGDSTSLGLMVPAYQPRPRLRIDARYRAVGVNRVITEISGARSIVETYRGQPNAEQVVESRSGFGYHGCWVLALGTNEVANQQVGGVVPLDDRIDRVMRHLDGQPALWTNVRTRVQSGPYAESHMDDWGAALARACDRYPNLRVYDWASDVDPSWYIPDGIHYTQPGYAERGRLIAAALAKAFPEGAAASPRCVVRAG
jgi:peptidoglycan/LPS O-acetylase OafA/YrhL